MDKKKYITLWAVKSKDGLYVNEKDNNNYTDCVSNAMLYFDRQSALCNITEPGEKVHKIMFKEVLK
jgi:hypothetical protein